MELFYVLIICDCQGAPQCGTKSEHNKCWSLPKALACASITMVSDALQRLAYLILIASTIQRETPAHQSAPIKIKLSQFSYTYVNCIFFPLSICSNTYFIKAKSATLN